MNDIGRGRIGCRNHQRGHQRSRTKHPRHKSTGATPSHHYPRSRHGRPTQDLSVLRRTGCLIRHSAYPESIRFVVPRSIKNHPSPRTLDIHESDWCSLAYSSAPGRRARDHYVIATGPPLEPLNESLDLKTSSDLGPLDVNDPRRATSDAVILRRPSARLPARVSDPPITANGDGEEDDDARTCVEEGRHTNGVDSDVANECVDHDEVDRTAHDRA